MRIIYVYVIAVILLALTFSLVSINVALGTYSSWVGYKSPLIDVLGGVEPVRVGGEPIAGHVVFILLDGLRVDTLMDLSGAGGELGKLVSMGAFYPSGLANTPTYSIPGRASILTGAPPEVNGVLSNDFKGVLGVDSIVRAARDAGFKVICVGDKSIEMMFSDLIDECSRVDEGGGHGAISLAEGLRLFKKYSGAGHRVFLWVGVADIDMVGHLSGGSMSSEYNATVANIGRLALNFVESLSGEGALIVLLTDHGFKRVGHHGGPELEVRRVFTIFIGPGVKPGVYDVSYTHNDIAPTVAMIMGLRIPALSMGKVLVEGFDIPGDRVREYSVASREQASRVVAAIGEATGVRLSLDDPWSSYSAITSSLYGEGAGSRLALVSALAILVLAGLYASLRVHLLGPKRLIALTLAGLIVYEAAYWVAYSLARGPTSLSDVLSLGELLDKVRISAVAAGVVLAVFLGFVELTPFRVGLSRILVPTVTASALAVIVGLALAAPFYVSYGHTVRFPPPDWSGGFMFFVYLVKASFTGLMGMPLAVIIVAAFSLVGLYIYKLSRKAGELGA